MPRVGSHVRNRLGQLESRASAPLARIHRQSLLKRDAGGSRTHSESCFAGSRRTVWLQRQSSVLARNRTWTSTFAGLHANPAHPEDESIPTWIRTRAWTFGGSNANPLHHRDKVVRSGPERTGAIFRAAPGATFTKVAAFFPLPSAHGVSGQLLSTSARSRTPCGSFGGCPLTQEHTRVCRHSD